MAAVTALIDNPELSPTEIRKLVKGPDFPTGGYIYGRAGIKDYQETGRGRIVMRARAVIEEKESSNKSQIVVTELPYQVNKAKLISDMADLVKDAKLGDIIVGEDGMTLYTFTPDTAPNKSTCNGECATNWPPFVVDEGDTAPAGHRSAGTAPTARRQGRSRHAQHHQQPP